MPLWLAEYMHLPWVRRVPVHGYGSDNQKLQGGTDQPDPSG